MSLKRLLIAIAAIFVAWQIVDAIVHFLILGPVYAETEELWRPMEEMKMGLIRLVSLIGATVFCYTYARFVSGKSLRTGVVYGVLWGVAYGTSMAYGMYATMPIPYHMALVWFVGTLARLTLAGLLAGWLIVPPPAQADAESGADGP